MRFLLLVLIAALAGCATTSDDASDDSFPFYIRVVDAATGEPVSNARVKAFGPFHLTLAILEPEKRDTLGFIAFTDSDGRACFEASFLREWPQALQSDGSAPETRWEVDCGVTVTKVGYEPTSLELAHTLGITFITHSTKLAEIVVELEKEPNKPVQSNSVDAPRKSGAVTAISRLPRSV